MFRNLLFVCLAAVAAYGCGGDDDEKNRNPLAPSVMESSSIGEPTATLGSPGNGGSAGVLPAAGPSFDGQVRGAGPAACQPAPAIVAAAERNRQANDRPPGYGRSWKQLLVFFGEDWPGHDAVTLAEMDARVGRWGGWKPFRDEVARLLDCGWSTGGTTVEIQEPDPPLPQQSAPTAVTYEPANATVTEGEYLRIHFNGVADNYCLSGAPPDWLTGVAQLDSTSLYCTSTNPILLATKDDNAVGANKTFTLIPHTDGPDASFPTQTLTVVEDDLLQVRLQARDHDGNDYGAVDLEVSRDHEGLFWIEVEATGAARLGAVTAGGNTRSASGTDKKKQTKYGNGLEAQRDRVRTFAVTCANDGEGWVDARGSGTTRATTDKVQVCYSGAANPNAGQKISGHATATFPLRMSCQTWADTNGGATREVHSELRNAGWSPLLIEPAEQVSAVGFPTHRAAHPRPCNVDFVHIWSALGMQTAQVACTVGETLVAALDDGTYTTSSVIDRVRDHFAPAYRAFCLQR